MVDERGSRKRTGASASPAGTLNGVAASVYSALSTYNPLISCNWRCADSTTSAFHPLQTFELLATERQ
jgi:hypothetical protein